MKSLLKNILSQVNSLLLNKLVLSLSTLIFNFPQVMCSMRSRNLGCNFNYRVIYQKNSHNYLSVLCDEHGSDKGEVDSSVHPHDWVSHTYSDFMNDKFYHSRLHVKRVFECGIGTNKEDFAANMGLSGRPGASLRVWRDYFPNADVYGADIDSSVLFEEQRIRTFQVDQTSKESVVAMWNEIGLDEFDIIVDDGLHTFEGGVSLFESSIDKLGAAGVYVIEDVSSCDLVKYSHYFHGKEFSVQYVNLYRPNVDLRDNSLVVITKLHYQEQ